MHVNSLDAYDHIESTGSKQARAEAILECYQNGKSYTDRDILKKLFVGSDDMNMVKPRITELIDARELEEVGKTTCKVTGRPVRLVQIRVMKPLQTKMF